MLRAPFVLVMVLIPLAFCFAASAEAALLSDAMLSSHTALRLGLRPERKVFSIATCGSTRIGLFFSR